MGWFDEQIRERENADRAVFEDSFQALSGAVMGRRMTTALNDNRQVTADAIGDILKYYHAKPQDIPDTIHDMNEVLEYLLRPYGIMRRNVKLEKGWYRDATGAMLGTRKDDSSVVALIPFGLNSYRFYDRKAGKWVHLNRTTQDLIEQDAIAFYKPFPLTKMNIGSLARYIIQQISPGDIVMLVLSMLAVTVIGMLMPWLNKLLFSEVLEFRKHAGVAGHGNLHDLRYSQYCDIRFRKIHAEHTHQHETVFVGGSCYDDANSLAASFFLQRFQRG